MWVEWITTCTIVINGSVSKYEKQIPTKRFGSFSLSEWVVVFVWMFCLYEMQLKTRGIYISLKLMKHQIVHLQVLSVNHTTGIWDFNSKSALLFLIFAQFSHRLLTERRLAWKLCNDFDSCNAISFCYSFFLFVSLFLFRWDFVPTPIIDDDDDDDGVVAYYILFYFALASINLSQSNKRVHTVQGVTDILTGYTKVQKISREKYVINSAIYLEFGWMKHLTRSWSKANSSK